MRNGSLSTVFAFSVLATWLAIQRAKTVQRWLSKSTYGKPQHKTGQHVHHSLPNVCYEMKHIAIEIHEESAPVESCAYKFRNPFHH